MDEIGRPETIHNCDAEGPGGLRCQMPARSAHPDHVAAHDDGWWFRWPYGQVGANVREVRFSPALRRAWDRPPPSFDCKMILDDWKPGATP